MAKKSVPVYEKKAKKRVTEPISIQNYQQKKPIWRFDWMDRNGKFAFDLSRIDFPHGKILEKFIEYGNKSWAEIIRQTHDFGKSKHHILEYSGISSEGKARIREMRLEEYTDTIFSFALENKLRIIGIRLQDEFHVIWFDPNHEFYPSRK